MSTVKMLEELKQHRGRHCGFAARTVAAAMFGVIGYANAQSRQITPASATPIPAKLDANDSNRPFRINVLEEAFA